MLIGQPVIGVDVDVYDGAFHPVDSSDMAFKLCAKTLFRENYSKMKPVVLEPMMNLEVSVPDEFQGAATGLVNQRRGIIMSTGSEGGFTTIVADAPLAAMFGFSTDLRSCTQGKGEFSMEFSKYNPAPKQVQEELVKKYQEKRAAESA